MVAIQNYHLHLQCLEERNISEEHSLDAFISEISAKKLEVNKTFITAIWELTESNQPHQAKSVFVKGHIDDQLLPSNDLKLDCCPQTLKCMTFYVTRQFLEHYHWSDKLLDFCFSIVLPFPLEKVILCCNIKLNNEFIQKYVKNLREKINKNNEIALCRTGDELSTNVKVEDCSPVQQGLLSLDTKILFVENVSITSVSKLSYSYSNNETVIKLKLQNFTCFTKNWLQRKCKLNNIIDPFNTIFIPIGQKDLFSKETESSSYENIWFEISEDVDFSRRRLVQLCFVDENVISDEPLVWISPQLLFNLKKLKTPLLDSETFIYISRKSHRTNIAVANRVELAIISNSCFGSNQIWESVEMFDFYFHRKR